MAPIQPPPPDALYSQAFPAQIFRSLDAGFDDQVVGNPVVKSGDDNEVSAFGDRGYYRASGPADLDVSRQHAGKQRRTAAHVDDLRVDAVFGEKTLILGDPEGCHAENSSQHAQ
jgi:hypothetical protein